MKKESIYSDQNFEKVYADFQSWMRTNHILSEELTPGSAAGKRRREKNLSNPWTNETSKIGGDYRVMSMQFRSKNRPVFAKASQKDTIQNALETISQYEPIIPVKITQSYLGLADFLETQDKKKEAEYNESAKAVHSAVESSFQAWQIILDAFDNLEPACRKNMILLDRIRKRLMADFPDSRDFIRPASDGFVHN